MQHKAILTLKDFVKEPVNYDAEFDFLKKLSDDVLEIKAMFKRFTTVKEQRSKDEQARRRERTWG